MRTAWDLIVIPRSRSRSIESSSCSRMSREATVWVISRMRSASVDLPWSMWAMIEKLRMRLWSDKRPPRIEVGGRALGREAHRHLDPAVAGVGDRRRPRAAGAGAGRSLSGGRRAQAAYDQPSQLEIFALALREAHPV